MSRVSPGQVSGFHLAASIMVGALVALGAMAYSILTQPALPLPEGGRPTVFLNPAVLHPTVVLVNVGRAEPAFPLQEFGANLRYESDVLLGGIAALFDGAARGNLSFSDRDGGGRLTPGDRFTINTVRPGIYELVLFHRDVEVARQTWTR